MTKNLRTLIKSRRYCSKTNKYIYKFTVCGITEESAAKTHFETRMIAYKRIAELQQEQADHQNTLPDFARIQAR